MSEITNADYITINANGIFVGGKPATKYRGEEISLLNNLRNYFANIQKKHPDVAELHVLSSETRGKYAVAGNPSEKHGPNAWCRVKFKNGKTTSRVFDRASSSAAFCASNCAGSCAYAVRGDASSGSAADCAAFCAYRCAYYDRDDASSGSAVFGEIDNTESTQKKPVLARLVEKLKNRQH